MMKKCLSVVIGFSFLGTPPVNAQKILPFTGQIDFVSKKLFVNVETEAKGTAALTVSEAAKDNYHFALSLDHLRTLGFDISTQLKSLVSVAPPTSGESLAFQGELLSQYTLINYKPVSELSGSFRIKDRVLYLDSFSIGGITASGTMQLMHPFKVDMAFNITDIAMGDFLKFWGAQEEIYSEGQVSGDVRILGAIDRPSLRGSFSTHEGVVDELRYNHIVLNVEGLYPVVHLTNSSVAQTDGMAFNLEGSLDLADRQNLEEGVAALKTTPVVNNDPSSSEWTLKRKNTSGQPDSSEFKYFLRKEHKDHTAQEETDLLGVERSIRF